MRTTTLKCGLTVISSEHGTVTSSGARYAICEVDGETVIETAASMPDAICRAIELAAARVGLTFTQAALENIEETGCDPRADVEALRSGAHTRESLLAHCLDGADADRVEGWREYVATVSAAAAV